MSKWFGKVGYVITEETEPGLWVPTVIEKEYFGEVISNRWGHQNSDKVNDDIRLTNVISIMSDEFAYHYCSSIAYVEYMGAKWKVTDIEPQHPRLRLTIGGVYNG